MAEVPYKFVIGHFTNLYYLIPSRQNRQNYWSQFGSARQWIAIDSYKSNYLRCRVVWYSDWFMHHAPSIAFFDDTCSAPQHSAFRLESETNRSFTSKNRPCTPKYAFLLRLVTNSTDKYFQNELYWHRIDKPANRPTDRQTESAIEIYCIR